MGHNLPLSGHTHALDGCPYLQQRLHCGTPTCLVAGAMVRRCLLYIKAWPTRLRIMRPARESLMSNQRVPVSERREFQVRCGPEFS